MEASKRVLKLFPYGLYAVGVRHGEARNAFTANWVTQVSFEPPMLAVAMENDGASLAMVRASGAFSVNVYAAGQRREAGRLARPAARAPDKIAEFAWRDGATGAPVLTDTLGCVECRVARELPCGDHTLVVGEIVAAELFREGEALEIHAAGFTYAG